MTDSGQSDSEKLDRLMLWMLRGVILGILAALLVKAVIG